MRGKSLKLRPIIQLPRRARPGEKYLMTVDLEPVDPEEWTYKREEYVLTVILDTMPLFEHQVIGEPALILHRFGGTYEPARFSLRASMKEMTGDIRVTLVNESGFPAANISTFDVQITEGFAEPTRINGTKEQAPDPSLTLRAPQPKAKRLPRRSEEDLIYFNGIDALASDYSITPLAMSDLATQVLSFQRDLREERTLRWQYERDFRDRAPDRRPAPDVDPLDLSSSGWGVIFSRGTPRAIRGALDPLLELRESQASRKKESYYRELTYFPGESRDSFFRRYGVELGPAHPEYLPYYLLIVGGPEDIPFRFQYQLGMQYAVGRLHFDAPDAYRRYAQSVVAAESGLRHVRPNSAFFSTQHEGDDTTHHLKNGLVEPLVKNLRQSRAEWSTSLVTDGRKNSLTRLMGHGETPALLFATAHGLTFPKGHRLQPMRQGSIVCEEWPGVGTGPVTEDCYFSAGDIGDSARFHGLIAFLMGSYSVGSYQVHSHYLQSLGARSGNAPKPFTSSLAQRLLSHPNGSALAVLGYVDQVWGHSPKAVPDHHDSRKPYVPYEPHIESLLRMLYDGFPVGLAMDWISERFAELSTRLTDVLDALKSRGKFVKGASLDDPHERMENMRAASLWMLGNDARSIALLGDPAIRLATGPKLAQKPELTDLRRDPGAILLDAEKTKGSSETSGEDLEGRDPIKLQANAGLAFMGSVVLSKGFTLTAEEREKLIERNPKNAERIFPHLGGQELNTSPTQSHHRYVINFDQMNLEEAGRWPDLLEIVRRKVKPERSENKREAYQKYWWQFGAPASILYESISSVSRCLVNSQLSKHLCFAFQPNDRIFANTLYAYLLERFSSFAVLQSRIHEFWVRRFSSYMKADIRYSIPRCFETFPFPDSDPRAGFPILEDIGERLYEARASYMLDMQQGLTKIYNYLKDPTRTDAMIAKLRQLHEEMDRAVLAEYGWDAEVPPYTSPVTPDENRRLETFADEIIDKLFALNAERVEQERGLGSRTSKKEKTLPAEP